MLHTGWGISWRGGRWGHLDGCDFVVNENKWNRNDKKDDVPINPFGTQHTQQLTHLFRKQKEAGHRRAEWRDGWCGSAGGLLFAITVWIYDDYLNGAVGGGCWWVLVGAPQNRCAVVCAATQCSSLLVCEKIGTRMKDGLIKYPNARIISKLKCWIRKVLTEKRRKLELQTSGEKRTPIARWACRV